MFLSLRSLLTSLSKLYIDHFRPENAKIGADPTLIGAHKWLYSWETAVKKHRCQLIPLVKNLIDIIWTGDGRGQNQDPLEILNGEFAGE